MSLVRAIETQRDALLRLLARLMLIVAILSDTRLDSKLSRWLCRTVSSMLTRAEAAAGYLVIASSGVLAAQGAGTRYAQQTAGRGKLTAFPRCALSADGSDSCEGLLARIRVLKAILETLPRHALRLLRREAARGYAGTSIGFAMDAEQGSAVGFLNGLCRQPRIERPPDKPVALVCTHLNSLPVTGREAFACARYSRAEI